MVAVATRSSSDLGNGTLDPSRLDRIASIASIPLALAFALRI
jgi:hypothetical protein